MRQLQYFFYQLLFLFSLTASSACQQSADSLPGVYAGVKLSLNPLGGAMNRTDVVILLRKDKTFTDELKKKDWKTAVRGNYTLKGSTLQLLYKNGDKDEFTVNPEGTLDAGTFVLFKMELDNTVPKGSYKFKLISGSGGISTGTTYIGSSSSRELNFDGAGKFNTNRQSSTVISGENIGGGTNSNTADKGQYTLKDGTLTLKYDNGSSTVHSFFASAGDAKNKTMAVIDGSFYFTEDAKTKGSTNAKKATSTDKALPTAQELFSALRKKYGGPAIDAIRTYTVEAELNGIRMISYNDIAGGRFRNEIYKDGKLVTVEQIAGDNGWQWVNGRKTASTRERIQETHYNDHIGIFGLQQKFAATFAKASIQQTENGYSLSFKVDGHLFTYLIDEKYRIVGDGYQIGANKLINSYSNEKTIDGLSVPFTTTSSNGKQKITIDYKSFELNKPLKTDWMEVK